MPTPARLCFIPSAPQRNRRNCSCTAPSFERDDGPAPGYEELPTPGRRFGDGVRGQLMDIEKRRKEYGWDDHCDPSFCAAAAPD
eukprot:Skav224602  [mRNA]  locus=scaffold2684:357963:359529:- [translate_table: standard]